MGFSETKNLTPKCSAIVVENGTARAVLSFQRDDGSLEQEAFTITLGADGVARYGSGEPFAKMPDELTVALALEAGFKAKLEGVVERKPIDAAVAAEEAAVLVEEK